MVLLMVDGDQVPVTPFGDVVAKAGAGEPEHKNNEFGKFGTIPGCTTTFNTCVVAHCPAVGVNV